MITHLSYSSTTRLLAVLATALAFVVLIASSAATPANAGSSQFMFSAPHSSWGHSNGWRMQRGGMNGGMNGGMQNWGMRNWGMQNGGQPRFDGNGARQFSMGDFGQFGMDGNGARQFSMGNFGQFGMGDFHHDGGNFHHDGNHHDDFFDDHHDHFHNGVVIVSPGFFNPFVNPFFFNPGFAGAPVFVSPGFVTPTPFIAQQPGVFVGQPFVTGQPQFFVDPRSAAGQPQSFLGLGSGDNTGNFVPHASLGQSSWWHRTDGGWMRSPTMSSHVTVIRPGMPMMSGNVTVIRPGVNPGMN